jgi:hypothetical protein
MTESLIKPNSYINFKNNKVTFITFNYDRSLEYFFYESLRNSFSTENDDDIIEQIPIFHVYGKVLNLPWENNSSNVKQYLDSYHSPYHKTFDLESLQKLKSNIRIIYESKQHDFSGVKDKILNAKKIFFLGFGFAPENLEILDLNKIFRYDQKIYGTAFGLRKKEIEDIRMSISTNFNKEHTQLNNIKIENENCLTLLRDYL